MYKLAFIVFIWPSVVFAQADEMTLKRKAYKAMVSKLLSHTVAELEVTDSLPEGAIFLDARAKGEYQVSHIDGAKYVGYDDFKINRLKDLNKNIPIIVYCSVGYRSEKIAEKLEKAGYEQVYNLLGGIFEWHNSGLEVIDSEGVITDDIHGYNSLWGQWLDSANVVYKP
ncbi:rhodanese-like domain-containing protein [Reichenbachiella versicolor]|uniref:rhodanese-like domain-containing protein n=1 Tax=Reichenbachiella versicolor TaxID=1821036 RepID=UPI001FEAFDD4|nr:rhodanese-like domain-containing protein [Reichenbachiella versicolor]